MTDQIGETGRSAKGEVQRSRQRDRRALGGLAGRLRNGHGQRAGARSEAINHLPVPASRTFRRCLSACRPHRIEAGFLGVKAGRVSVEPDEHLGHRALPPAHRTPRAAALPHAGTPVHDEIGLGLFLVLLLAGNGLGLALIWALVIGIPAGLLVARVLPIRIRGS